MQWKHITKLRLSTNSPIQQQPLTLGFFRQLDAYPNLPPLVSQIVGPVQSIVLTVTFVGDNLTFHGGIAGNLVLALHHHIPHLETVRQISKERDLGLLEVDLLGIGRFGIVGVQGEADAKVDASLLVVAIVGVAGEGAV